MTVSRNFLLIGSLYLLVGLGFGMYMGATGKHTFIPVHAHINLLGFTLMSIFGLAYRLMPELAGSALATAHFWLHQIGALVLLVALFLMFSGQVPEAKLTLVLPLSQVAILLGILSFTWNLFRNAK